MAEITKAVIGKNDIVEKILMAVLAGGHVLMEDIPGVGKTTMALAFSRVLSLKENRMAVLRRMLCLRISPAFLFFRKIKMSLYTSRVRSCATCFWQMRSTVLLRKRSPHFWR